MNLYLGIDHVQLAAPPGCEAAARKFYVEILCMRELSKPADLQRVVGFGCNAACIRCTSACR